MPKLGDFERLVRVESGGSVNVLVSSGMDFDTEQGTDTASGRKYYVYLLKCKDSAGAPIVLRGGRGMVDALAYAVKGSSGEVKVKLSRNGKGINTEYYAVIM